jgi:hypothetical protein
MGGLVPNPNDLEVINALNGVFSEPRLTALRDWKDAHDPNFFAAGRRLHRIAYRLKIHPTTGANPRGRWFKFLKNFLKERPNGVGGSKNHDIILAAIDGFVDDRTNCSGIRFWARYSSGAELPAGIDYGAVVTQETPDPTTGAYWGSITLLCRHDLGAIGTIPDPTQANGEADPGEGGAEQPSV